MNVLGWPVRLPASTAQRGAAGIALGPAWNTAWSSAGRGHGRGGGMGESGWPGRRGGRKPGGGMMAAHAYAVRTASAKFGILGPLEVWRSGRAVPLGGPRQRAVLALLLLEANRVVSMDR